MAEALAGGHHVVMPLDGVRADDSQRVATVPGDLPVGTRVGLMTAAFMSGLGVATDDLRGARRVQQVVGALQRHASPRT